MRTSVAIILALTILEAASIILSQPMTMSPSTASSNSSPQTTVSPSTLRTSSTMSATTTNGMSYCLHGGTFDGNQCICSPEFYGPRCETLIERFPADCLHGGTFDGNKCICSSEFYGPRCETLIERFPAGRTVETTVLVELKLHDKVFDEALKNSITEEYKQFEMEFKKEMNYVYSNLPGYKGIEIIQIREGSVIVEHNVIVEIEYKEDVSVTEQYDNIIRQVKTQIIEQDCTNNSSFCIDKDTFTVEGNNVPLTEKELCKVSIPDGYKEYISALITAEGLICVSHCDSLYYNALDCNGGSCQIQNGTGPHCFCPRTDLYLYTSKNCQGRMLKSGIYGGIGAAIAVLVIVLLVIIGFMFKRKKVEKSEVFAQDKHENLYEDINDDNSGVYNLSQRSVEDWTAFRPSV